MNSPSEKKEELKTKVVLTRNDPQIKAITGRIVEALKLKARREGKPQFENNKTHLGGVSFWFAKNDSGDFFLIYTSPPETWDVDAVKYELGSLEHDLWLNSLF